MVDSDFVFLFFLLVRRSYEKRLDKELLFVVRKCSVKLKSLSRSILHGVTETLKGSQYLLVQCFVETLV